MTRRLIGFSNLIAGTGRLGSDALQQTDNQSAPECGRATWGMSAAPQDNAAKPATGLRTSGNANAFEKKFKGRRSPLASFHRQPSDAPVAQLDRASDYEFEGRTFESLRARHFGSKARTPSTAASTPEAAVSVRSSSLRSPRIRTSFRRTTSTRWATART